MGYKGLWFPACQLFPFLAHLSHLCLFDMLILVIWRDPQVKKLSTSLWGTKSCQWQKRTWKWVLPSWTLRQLCPLPMPYLPPQGRLRPTLNSCLLRNLEAENPVNHALISHPLKSWDNYCVVFLNCWTYESLLSHNRWLIHFISHISSLNLHLLTYQRW